MKNPFRFISQNPASTPEIDFNDPHGILLRGEFVSEQWYKSVYDTQSNLSAAQHYLALGFAKGFEPNPLFRGKWYAKKYVGVMETNLNPAVHYMAIGSKRGLRPNPFFDPAWYRKAYPDVAASDVEPLVHYLKYGAREGRNPSGDVLTQWLPQAIDPGTGQITNPLAKFLELLDLLNAGTISALNTSIKQ